MASRPKPKTAAAPQKSDPNVISSRQNPLLKELTDIRDDRDSPLLFLEGPKLILEALNANCKLEMLVVSEEFPQISFLDPIVAKTRRVIKVSESVFKAISDVERPQGLLAIGRQPDGSWESILAKKPAPIVVLDGIQDPGNAATIIRTAEAADAAGIVSTPLTAHLFSPKALRGAMGSSLRVPILEHVPIDRIATTLRKAGYSIAATPLGNPESAVRYDQVDWTKPWAIVVGQEGKGMDPVWKKLMDKHVLIPMSKPVQSLNVGAAAAVLLYESYRNRLKGE